MRSVARRQPSWSTHAVAGSAEAGRAAPQPATHCGHGYANQPGQERHVANIYLKVGAHSKAEAAAYALRHGLA